MEDSFRKFGMVRSVWIARKPPGFGFVEFDDPRDADDACKELDGKEMDQERITDPGNRIRVQLSNGGKGGGGGGGGSRGGRDDDRGGGGGYGASCAPLQVFAPASKRTLPCPFCRRLAVSAARESESLLPQVVAAAAAAAAMVVGTTTVVVVAGTATAGTTAAAHRTVAAAAGGAPAHATAAGTALAHAAGTADVMTDVAVAVTSVAVASVAVAAATSVEAASAAGPAAARRRVAVMESMLRTGLQSRAKLTANPRETVFRIF